MMRNLSLLHYMSRYLLLIVCFLLSFQPYTMGNCFKNSNIFGVLSDQVVNVSSFGAKGDGITDDTESINKAIIYAKNKTLNFDDNKVYLIKSKLDFSKWSGRVLGKSWIKCDLNTKFSQVIDLSLSHDVIWNYLSVDMGQSLATEDNDLRSDNGFYMFNSRNITINDVQVKNVRIGEPIYINGSSSKSAGKSDGSKYIYINRFKCIAIPYNKVDRGVMFIVRSDFYTGTGYKGEIYGASNGVNRYKYKLDQSFSLPQTTEHVYINDCYMENFDRLALLNVRNVKGSNNRLINFYTRGITLSPTCSNVEFRGGAVGANAAMINVNLCCNNITFDGIEALGSKTIVGQRHAIRTGQGCSNIMFKNIHGYGCETALAVIEGVHNVTFDNVHLKSWKGNSLSTNAIIIGANNGVDSDVSFQVTNIRFINCSFQARYGIFYRKYGLDSVDFSQIRFENVKFKLGSTKYNTDSKFGIIPKNINTKGISYIK